MLNLHQTKIQLFSSSRHAASWKDKLLLLDKFEDKRLLELWKKIIYQEAPEILPSNIFKSIKRSISKRILSQNRENGGQFQRCYKKLIRLREKYSDENDHEKLKFLDELNEYVMSIQKNMKIFNVDNLNKIFLKLI